YNELREKGHIDRAWLGILPQEVPDEVREKLGLGIGQGVFVATVTANKNEEHTPAERAGVKPGDVILKWNDHVATDPTCLSRAIAATEIGSKATLVLVRQTPEGKKELSLEVPVERRPTDEE